MLSPMNVNHKKFGIVLGVILLMGATSATAAPSITGKWAVQTAKGMMMTLAFNPDGTWEFDRNGDMVKDIWGKYSVRGTTLTVTATGGLQTCPFKQPGTYTIQQNGPQLTFIQIKDACDARAADFSLFWTQQ